MWSSHTHNNILHTWQVDNMTEIPIWEKQHVIWSCAPEHGNGRRYVITLLHAFTQMLPSFQVQYQILWVSVQVSKWDVASPGIANIKQANSFRNSHAPFANADLGYAQCWGQFDIWGTLFRLYAPSRASLDCYCRCKSFHRYYNGSCFGHEASSLTWATYPTGACYL